MRPRCSQSVQFTTASSCRAPAVYSFIDQFKKTIVLCLFLFEQGLNVQTMIYIVVIEDEDCSHLIGTESLGGQMS